MHHRGLLGNLVQVFDDARGDVVVAQDLGHPAGLAGAFDAEQHAPAVGHVLLDLGGEGFDIAVPAGDVDQVEVLAGLGVRVGHERRHRPPALPAFQGVRADVGELLVGAGPQVDGRASTRCRGCPTCMQELLAGAHQVFGAGADQFGIIDQNQGATW